MFEQIPETPYGFRRRLQFIYTEIEDRISAVKDRKRIRVLDIGCGTGELVTLPLGCLGTTILGIDNHLESIERAKSKNIFQNVEFKCTCISDLPDQQFDFIICSEILEHLADPSEMLRLIRRRLTRYGICIITIPNGYGPKEIEGRLWKLLRGLGLLNALKSLRSILLARAKGIVNAKGNPKPTLNTGSIHMQFFSYTRFRRMVERNGMSIVKQRNRRFLSGPFSNRILSKSESLIDWNVRVADFLPRSFSSSWMFVVQHQNY